MTKAQKKVAKLLLRKIKKADNYDDRMRAVDSYACYQEALATQPPNSHPTKATMSCKPMTPATRSMLDKKFGHLFPKEDSMKDQYEKITGYRDRSQLENCMSKFRNYRKKNVQPMRPYVPGEDLIGISVSQEDTPEEGGMVAVNPENPEDRWYVGKDYFLANYEATF